MGKHTLDPIRYIYRGHYITLRDGAWVVTDGCDNGEYHRSGCLDDCTTTIDQVMDDGPTPVCEPSCIVIPRWP